MLLNCAVGEDSWESIGLQGDPPVNRKGDQSWIFIGRTDADAEAEAPGLWPSDVKSWLIRKNPDAGKDWRQEKGTTEDEMVGWHHQLDWHDWARTGKPGMLQSVRLQKVRHDWPTEQQQQSFSTFATQCLHHWETWLLLVSECLVCLVSPLSPPTVLPDFSWWPDAPSIFASDVCAYLAWPLKPNGI